MLSSPLFTLTSLLATVCLGAIVAMQVLECMALFVFGG